MKCLCSSSLNHQDIIVALLEILKTRVNSVASYVIISNNKLSEVLLLFNYNYSVIRDGYAMKKINYLIDCNLVLMSSRSGFPLKIFSNNEFHKTIDL